MDRDHRLVVCAAGGSAGFLELPESRVDDERPYISGGERSLYELAVAAASLGMEVELRGHLNRTILDVLTGSAGAGPHVGLTPRAPDPRDIIVLPEALPRELIASAAMSNARSVMYLLAPPGLMGWSFRPEWAVPDITSVPVDAVGTPAAFRSISGMGFSLLTNSKGTAEAGRRAGVDVHWIGCGTPVPFPGARDKRFDVAVVEHNRWSAQAERVLAALGPVSVKRIPPTPSSYSLSAELADAGLLIWPSRLEGGTRVPREARAVGTVPVLLGSNPYRNRAEGEVVVDDLEAMAPEIRSLIGDRDRRERLGNQGIRSAAAEADWPAFVERVAGVIHSFASAPVPETADTWRELADHLRYQVNVERAGYLSRIAALETDIVRLDGGAQELRATADRMGRELGASEAELQALQSEIQLARDELAAYRHRFLSRLVDGSVLGPAWRRVKPSRR